MKKPYIAYVYAMARVLVCAALLALPAPAVQAKEAVAGKKAGIDMAEFMPGDIIFQEMNSFQSKALRLATGSRYTHCGIILPKNGELYVLEAVGPVTWTPVSKWIARGEQGKYVLMRLKKDAPGQLTKERLAAMQKQTAQYVGKPYDLRFQWSDDTIYCSELVWKLYERGAGISLAPLRTFKDYDLDHEEVQKHIKERFNYDIPWDEQVIAPSDLMRSDQLEIVRQN